MIARTFRPLAVVQKWERPFQNNGASVYAGGSLPLNYRNRQVMPTLGNYLVFQEVAKTTRIATDTGTAGDELTLSPDLSAYAGGDVYVDVLHFRDDVENESHHPQKITLDGGGDGTNTILGSATSLGYTARSVGIVRFPFRWIAHRDGLQPTSFELRRTAGPTSPAAVSTSANGSGIYEIESGTLDDSSTYTFTIVAINGAVEVTVATISNVQADNTGPPAPANVVTSIV